MGCTSWNEHRSVVISRETDVSALDIALTYGTMLSIKWGWKASHLYAAVFQRSKAITYFGITSGRVKAIRSKLVGSA
jgi:hypothetical protein